MGQYDFTIEMALVDYIPVILFAIAAFILIGDLKNKMGGLNHLIYSLGMIAIAVAGAGKATWKLLIAANIADIQILNELFMPTQSVGFLLAGLGLIIMLMAKKGVSAAHNAVSNLKLGSGVMPYRKMKEAGVNVAFGTDGVASNNRLSVLRELQYAALIHKGVERDPAVTCAEEMIKCATKNGAVAQGRSDCGEIKVGAKADLVLIDMDSINNIPSYDLYSTVCYSASEEDVLLTVCDGNILYENGTYTTIDEELLKYNAKRVISHYFD